MTIENIQKVVGIAWAEHSNRLDAISEALGGKAEKISWLSGKKYLAPIRYFVLGIRSLWRLERLSPDVVIAQNPPIFCPLFAYLYTKVHRKKLVMDCHSLARDNIGQGFIWRALTSIESFLMRRTFSNTVIHEVYSSILAGSGIRSVVLYDAPPEINISGSKVVKTLIVICPLGGHPDEDVKGILEVAGAVEGIEVVVTGKWKTPIEHPRVKYVGFLPREKYLMELLSSRAGLCLIRGNAMTLPYVLFEFIAAGIPFVVNETPVTRILGHRFLAKNIAQVAEKLEMMKNEEHYAALVSEVVALREVLKGKSEEGFKQLRQAIYSQNNSEG